MNKLTVVEGAVILFILLSVLGGVLLHINSLKEPEKPDEYGIEHFG